MIDPATVPREAAVERELVRRVRALGGLCEKVRVAGRRGFFDRLVVLPGRVIFVESEPSEIRKTITTPEAVPRSVCGTRAGGCRGAALGGY